MALFDQLTFIQWWCLAVVGLALLWLLLDPLLGLVERQYLRRRHRECAESRALLAARPSLALRADLDRGALDLPALSGGDGRLGPGPPAGSGNGQPTRGGEAA